MKHSGWRKPTPGLGNAELLAQAGERSNISKNRSFLAFKRVAAHIGLKASEIILLDTLGAFTKPQDWEAGRRPIVWASNSYLIQQTGFSLSALKRHARRLCDAGIITFKDSPNGKRWGHRDTEGHIIEAYGYDLSPMAARAESFEVLFAEIQTERQLCARVKRQITILRRTIRAQLETAAQAAPNSRWTTYAQIFQSLLDHLPKRHVESGKLLELLDRFQTLKNKISILSVDPDEVIELADEEHRSLLGNTTDQFAEMAPREVIFEPHILDTNKLNPVRCNATENDENTCSETTTVIHQSAPKNDNHMALTASKSSFETLDLRTVIQACPSFTQIARDLGGYVRNWNELLRVAGQIRPMMGIKEHAWTSALSMLGGQTAAAIIALIYEKFSEGDITSPGAYLHGMLKKAGAGEMHLGRSFYGRLSARVT